MKRRTFFASIVASVAAISFLPKREKPLSFYEGCEKIRMAMHRKVRALGGASLGVHCAYKNKAVVRTEVDAFEVMLRAQNLNPAGLWDVDISYPIFWGMGYFTSHKKNLTWNQAVAEAISLIG